MSTFTLPPDAGRQKLSLYLRHCGLSLTLRRKLKNAPGAVLINGRLAPWASFVQPGDTVEVFWPAETGLSPVPLALSISYEDDHLLVVDKPAGLLVHPTSGPPEPTLGNAVIYHLRSRGLATGFHPVHRLDRNTSGLILIAKNPLVHHQLAAAGGKKLSRHYLAVVTGAVSPPSGVIDAPIGRKPGSIIERMVCREGQTAATEYETVAAAGAGSLLRLCLQTGRTHQIRVHLAHIGHPLYGDDLYGGPTGLIGRQALHAASLAFTHPATGQPLELTSPLPEDIVALLAALAGQGQTFSL
jgi:23S rRNA pseudouridine1911/1915/1917 synthase